MATCGYCGTSLPLGLGGVTVGDLVYCNEQCSRKGRIAARASQLPASVVAEHLSGVFRGPCPQCHGLGPVDVFTSHYVFSAIVYTQWSSEPKVSCRTCATKRQLAAMASNVFLGWWSFRGLFQTLVQIEKNIRGLRQEIALDRPSAALEAFARFSLAEAAEPRPESVDLAVLIQGLRSPDPANRLESSSALGDRGAAALAALPDLERLKDDPDRAVRMRAKWAVETIQEKSRRAKSQA